MSRNKHAISVRKPHFGHFNCDIWFRQQKKIMTHGGWSAWIPEFTVSAANLKKIYILTILILYWLRRSERGQGKGHLPEFVDQIFGLLHRL